MLKRLDVIRISSRRKCDVGSRSRLYRAAGLLRGPLDRLFQRSRYTVDPRRFKNSTSRRAQMLTDSICSFVQRLAKKAGGRRQMVSGTEQPARSLLLAVEGGNLGEADQRSDDAHPIVQP